MILTVNTNSTIAELEYLASLGIRVVIEDGEVTGIEYDKETER